MLLGAEISTYKQCHAGDCRTFFNAGNYHGYISNDGNTYFLYDEALNAYKDFTRAELQAFIDNIKLPGSLNLTTPADFISSITETNAGKVTTGILLLAALIFGVIIINKKF